MGIIGAILVFNWSSWPADLEGAATRSTTSGPPCSPNGRCSRRRISHQAAPLVLRLDSAGHDNQLEDEDRADYPHPAPSQHRRQQDQGGDLRVPHEGAQQRRGAKVSAPQFARDPREIVRGLEPL